MKYYFLLFFYKKIVFIIVITYRDVIEREEFLSLSSEQMIKLISSDELTVPYEEKVCKVKLIIINFSIYYR